MEYADDIQSASAAVQNLLLAAHHLGLGGCWICHLPPKKQLRKLLGIPDIFSPVAYVLIGHLSRPPEEMPRKYKADEIVCFNTFSSGIAIEEKSRIKMAAERILMRFYYLLPTWKTFEGQWEQIIKPHKNSRQPF